MSEDGEAHPYGVPAGRQTAGEAHSPAIHEAAMPWHTAHAGVQGCIQHRTIDCGASWSVWRKSESSDAKVCRQCDCSRPIPTALGPAAFRARRRIDRVRRCDGVVMADGVPENDCLLRCVRSAGLGALFLSWPCAYLFEPIEGPPLGPGYSRAPSFDPPWLCDKSRGRGAAGRRQGHGAGGVGIASALSGTRRGHPSTRLSSSS